MNEARYVPIKVMDWKKSKSGDLSVVTVQLRDPKEIEIFKKFLADEDHIKHCPICGHTNTLGAEDMVLQIDNPLYSAADSMEIATPIMTCDQCRSKVSLSMLDYNAFPSVVGFINSLRARLKEQRSSRNG